jgi:triphosphoribosyl-dephospho-CoA synthetase
MSITAEQIGWLARAALEQEAVLSPKPGLVDAENCGAHKDMDVALLLASAGALEPYFVRFAQQGLLEARLSPDGRLANIRADGVEAEQAMLAVTHGVNTHKGALFLLGVICYAAGHASASGVLAPRDLCTLGARLCRGITAELGKDTGRAFARYGARGARGEAEDGFPHVLLALDAFSRTIERGATGQDAWLVALLSLIATVEDTNVLARCGEATARELRRRAGELAARYPAGGAALADEIRALDCDCRAWNASPGGAADLLACAMFFRALEERETNLAESGRVSKNDIEL